MRLKRFAPLFLAPLAGALLVAPRPSGAQQRDADAVALDSLLDIKISTAAKYAQRIGEVASSVTIITSDDIERYGYRSIDEVLGSIPGFYTSYDRNYTYVGARGFSRPTDYNNRMLLLIDGNTVNETVFGSALMGSELAIPLHSIERVEVVRGPGSALYGTGAMLAVVNLITKSGAALDGLGVGLEGGSYGRRGGNAHFGRRFANGVDVALGGLWDARDGRTLYFPEFDTPETNKGVVAGLDWERRASILGAVRNGGLRLHGRYSRRTKAYPTASYETVFNAPGAETLDEYAFAELDYERELGSTRRLTTRGFYNFYSYDGGYPYNADDGSVVALRDGARNRIVGSEATLHWDIASGNQLTVGSELKRILRARSFTFPAPGEPADPDFDALNTVLSVYVQDEHQLFSHVSVLGGVRYDGYSAGSDDLSPRAALIVTPSHHTVLKLLYGEAFRAPSVYEAEVAESEVYINNPNLRGEKAHTLELVAQRRLANGVLGSMSLFNYHLHRLIDLTVDSATSLYMYRNVGSARSHGLELGVDAHVGALYSGFASYTFQRTRDGDGRLLTNSPEHLAKIGAAAQVTSWFRPALQLRVESSRRTVYDTRTSGYALADLNLAVTPHLGPWNARGRDGKRETGERFEMQLRLNNVFDKSYATPGGIEHVMPAIRQDGRNLIAELRYHF